MKRARISLPQVKSRHSSSSDYPELVTARERGWPAGPEVYVQEEFAAYLQCGRLEHGFLRLRCDDCHADKLIAFS